MVKLLIGDCRDLLKTLPSGSVHCCVTSPPYLGLRDYGVTGQIGLEQTPDEYVAEMVAVFREVRRVLRDDGTLWLNLGDSYSGSGKGPAGNLGKTHNEREIKQTSGIVPDGLKPKDLIGIPWSVATALRDPYYTGRIKCEMGRVWLAAMVDGEGCFYVHKRGVGLHSGGGYTRKTDTYSPAFEVANTHKAIVDRCMEIAGCGSVICQEKDRRQPLWRWTVRSDEARQIAREIYPYLVGKRQQCHIICGMPNAGERADAAWQAMKILHAGGATDVDFPAPANCLEPGWYLRQDIIWSKPNPMPESVRDRCTKAHEYIFLLSKSPRYYFDADAIAEPAKWERWGDQTENKTHPGTAGHLGGKTRSELPIKDTKNKRSVWTVPTRPYKGAHFATFPPDLIAPCILAGCPAGGTVLDPFGGSGTTGAVASANGRSAILIELNSKYTELVNGRCGLFLSKD